MEVPGVGITLRHEACPSGLKKAESDTRHHELPLMIPDILPHGLETPFRRLLLYASTGEDEPLKHATHLGKTAPL